MMLTFSCSLSYRSNLNLHPPDIFSLLRVLVVQSGQDPEPLDSMVALGGIDYVKTTSAPAANAIQRRSFQDYVSEEDQDYADELVLPSKPGSNPGRAMVEHMISPQSPQEAAVDGDESSNEGLNESADRGAIMSALFAPNTTAVASKLLRRALVKRGLFSG